MIDPKRYEVLSFDCYGTLIDWESGILEALRPVLLRHNVRLEDEEILQLYAKLEAEAERKEYVKYKDILRWIVGQFGRRFGFIPTASELDCLVDSLGGWRPFPDTVSALQALKKRFKLAIISNVDDDLFASTAELLKVRFDWVITAEQARSYKPTLAIFKFALHKIGIPSAKILHVAQSLYHDIAPAKRMGLATVWVNRRAGREGFGATPPASIQPGLEVPNLSALVDILSD